jgi:ATP-dependent RNA helicase DDX55/SPB4
LGIVVATPGRLDDIMDRFQIMNFKELEILVLDEADTLLNMGFAPAIGTPVFSLSLSLTELTYSM